ncbi:MAG: hypothetical protein AAF937_11360 [Planctomycetota bacterium]
MGEDKVVEMKPMHRRLEVALEGKTYRWISRATGIHPETVRRYMQGQSPSVDFVSSVCSQLQINPQWLLTGDGPMRRDEVRAHHLAEADPAELLAAIAATLDRLSERVDRLELFVQQLETHLSLVTPEAQSVDGTGSNHDLAERVGEALAERSRENADRADEAGGA